MAIGTTMAAVIGGGAALASGAMQSSAAKSASRAQQQAADQQIALQREIYDDQTQRFSPFLESGNNALAAYMYEMGLAERPTFGGSPGSPAVPASGVGGEQERPSPRDAVLGSMFESLRSGSWRGQRDRSDMDVMRREMAQMEARMRANQQQATPAQAAVPATPGLEYQGISMSPGARFAMEQGRDTMEAGAAAGGGLRSGATLSGLERLRFGMAAQDRENQLNRLGGLVDMGQGSAGMQAQAGNAFAGMASNALANQGNAAAAGAIGSGNAWGNAFGNLAGVAGYMANNQGPAAGSNWWNR